MAIKRKEQLLSLAPTGTGTFYSNWVNTENYKSLIFVVRAGFSGYGGGASSDYMDLQIEASSTNAAGLDAAYTRALVLTNPKTITVSKTMSRVTGDLTLPPDTSTDTVLRQQWDYNSPNIDEYVRLKYVVSGTYSKLGTILVDMYANKET